MCNIQKKTQGRGLVGGTALTYSVEDQYRRCYPGYLCRIFIPDADRYRRICRCSAGNRCKGIYWTEDLNTFEPESWCKFGSFGEFKYTLGLVIYVLLLIFFAYFYTSITFNPQEVSMNMKKQGGFIPGIRPGKPTVDYLTNVLNSIIFIGAIGLSIVAIIPIFFSGAFVADVSFGTSLIIIVGVVLETLKQIESQMLVRHYRGFICE